MSLREYRGASLALTSKEPSRIKSNSNKTIGRTFQLTGYAIMSQMKNIFAVYASDLRH